MLSRYVQQRIARLNHRRPPATRSGGLPTGKPRSKAGFVEPGRLPGRAVENASGEYWLVETPLAQVWADAASLGRATFIAREAGRSHDELNALEGHFPQATLLVDLETCGFSGSAVFLIGLVHCLRGELLVSQLLARNYAEERAILESFWQRTRGQRVLVSFNGKSFDWPMIRDRSVLHRLDFRVPDGWIHCDLLHHARRIWRGRFANCKLQTLERELCGRHRTGDLPGGQVPQAYHRFVRSGDDHEMKSVLHHNLLDLITLVQLAVRLLQDKAKRKGLPTSSSR